MSTQNQLVEFLRGELAIPADEIALALRKSGAMPNLLPVMLWKYGFVTTQQLDQIFDWLETSMY